MRYANSISNGVTVMDLYLGLLNISSKRRRLREDLPEMWY